ncbi:MAG: DNA primase [Pedosphaera sp.]|nr:DNA primase [Pedosphaera sp.]
MAGFIPDNLREQIRAASDIVDVIGGYVPLKRAGANFTALCPFHKEKTPSFNVNPQKQIFHCFGCHKGGDVFTFVKEYENIGFMDALRRLAERAKIPLEFDNAPGAQESRHLKDQLLQIHEQITQRWQSCLANEAAGQLARDYLAKRGVSAEAVKLFRLGAAPDAWDDTVNWAKSKGYDPALVEKAGLILKKEGAENHYDRFRGRLMFPICDEQGRVVGFSGRILSGDEKTAKYVNSPETPIFTKSKVFFGLDKSKRAILDAGFAIVCEGQLDLIACFMAGVQNIVAPQGTAFTEQHARIIKRYVDEVVLCFDSDNAGQNAAVRSLDSLLASGLAVRVAVVPAPHDPDSFIKANGGEAFQKLIEGAEGFFDYYLNRLCATNDLATDKGRTAVLRAMAEAVHKTGNTVLVDKHAQKTAHRLGVTPDAVRAEFKKRPPVRAALEPAGDETDETFEEAAEVTRPSAQEFWLLRLLFSNEDLVAWTAMHLQPDWVQHAAVREIVSRRLAAQSGETWTNLAAFLDECGSAEMQNLITEVVAEDRSLPNPEQQLADVVLRLRNLHLDRQIAALTHQISQPETGDAQRMEFLRQQQELRQLKKQPL